MATSTPYVQPDLNDSLGALMLGAFFNAMLYSHELTLMVSFFRNRDRTDAWYIKAGLAVLLLNDTVATAGQLACVYLYSITHWGDQSYISNQYWPIPLYLITTGTSALLCESFLIQRVYKITKSLVYPPILLVCCLTGFAGSLWSGYTIVTHSTYADRFAVEVPVTVWLIGSAVSDVAIAILLLVYLYRARQVAVRFEATRLQAPLRRMMLTTVESGSVSTVIALIALVIFLHNKQSNISVGFAFLLGRIYALTVLFCLFQKGSGGHAIGPISTSHEHYTGKRTRLAANAGQLVSGVQVHHTATVVVEDAQEHELEHFDDRYGTKPSQKNDALRVAPQMYMVPMGSDDEKVSYRTHAHDSV